MGGELTERERKGGGGTRKTLMQQCRRAGQPYIVIFENRFLPGLAPMLFTVAIIEKIPAWKMKECKTSTMKN